MVLSTTPTSSMDMLLIRRGWENCAPQPADVEQDFSIDAVPNELILHCFSFLHPKELDNTRRVCRKWNDLSNVELEKTDLKGLEKLFPKLTILDLRVWEKYIDLAKHGLEVCDTLPPRRDEVIEVMTELFATAKIENDAGITLLAVPRGYSLESANKSAKTPLKGNPTCIRYVSEGVRNQLGNQKVKKTYYVAITNSVLTGSRNKSVEYQKALLHEIGCAMPPYLSMLVLNLLTRIISSATPSTCLYDEDTYSRGEETVEMYGRDFHTVVGGFVLDGLFADSLNYDNSTIGVAALRKF